MIQKPKGTRDILPQESYKWQYVEEKVKQVYENYGFKEIRIPVFENTELFQRGVGETTDVVQKEMYTFEDKGGRSITLRPEGTAGVVRAYIENGMASMPSPVKMWYNMAMYRYENVQRGRYREFRQMGAEIIGSGSYLADVELIALGNNLFKQLQIPNIALNINSIGCPVCRQTYQEELRKFLAPNLGQYCEICKTRFDKNPMRILDCKEKKCQELNQGAPKMLDYLCEECKTHFENVKKQLESLDIPYEIDSNIVRGLDYYTKTVFEFVSKELNFTVLGGGRYDGLIKEIGGQDTPAVGFAFGLERMIETYEYYNKEAMVEPKTMDIYIATIGEEASIYAGKLAEQLRQKDIYVEKDINARSLKAQLKYADKIGSKYLLVLGEDEIKNRIGNLKNMETGKEKSISLSAEIIKEMMQ